MRFLNWEGARHRPGGAWAAFIKVASTAAALYVLWIGALAQVAGNAALELAGFLPFQFLLDFATWARAFSANWHLDISIFIGITFPIAFLTTTARRGREHLAWTDVALAALSLAVAAYYIVLYDRFLNWSRGFSQPTAWDTAAGLTLIALVIELCRRSVGWGLTTLVLLLLAFTVFGEWPLRIVLFACAVGTVSPRFDFTLAVTLFGASILAYVHLRGSPGKVDVSA